MEAQWCVAVDALQVAVPSTEDRVAHVENAGADAGADVRGRRRLAAAGLVLPDDLIAI